MRLKGSAEALEGTFSLNDLSEGLASVRSMHEKSDIRLKQFNSIYLCSLKEGEGRQRRRDMTDGLKLVSRPLQSSVCVS